MKFDRLIQTILFWVFVTLSASALGKFIVDTSRADLLILAGLCGVMASIIGRANRTSPVVYHHTCAWCGRELGVAQIEHSHGICHTCAVEQFGQDVAANDEQWQRG